MGTAGGVIQLVTRCASAEEFIERFARYTTATDVVVPALSDLTVGASGPFVICLNDGSIILKGRCEVTEIRRAAVAAGAARLSGPALMRLHLREMDAHSAGIHLRLMERQASAHRAPALPGVTPSPPREAVPALRRWRRTHRRRRSSATPVRGRTASRRRSPPRPEARVPGAALTLPANPLGDLDAADLASFIDLSLLETNGRRCRTGRTRGTRGTRGSPPGPRSSNRPSRGSLRGVRRRRCCRWVSRSAGLEGGSCRRAPPSSAAAAGRADGGCRPPRRRRQTGTRFRRRATASHA